ncbi:hypothetical protein L6E12_17745 [Actinokineospora sp. PR83]|uniref:hypothetical protein n=1 Tax=Actinokineospora sp. PR83 TaxID=2884908 RepID=UPI001F432643|nr:hypothetical protein [Actinokineospora sp. PR83]MCG8917629.1 hypothetical protein [Actinokineospora sp. PR83]
MDGKPALHLSSKPEILVVVPGWVDLLGRVRVEEPGIFLVVPGWVDPLGRGPYGDHVPSETE